MTEAEHVTNLVQYHLVKVNAPVVGVSDGPCFVVVEVHASVFGREGVAEDSPGAVERISVAVIQTSKGQLDVRLQPVERLPEGQRNDVTPSVECILQC